MVDMVVVETLELLLREVLLALEVAVVEVEEPGFLVLVEMALFSFVTKKYLPHLPLLPVFSQ